MSTTASLDRASTPATRLAGSGRLAAAASAVPWYLWAVVFASTSVVVGVIWDISWHRTIGRDTFWTPAHLAIYLGGATAGLACGWLVLRTTFAGTPSERAEGVSFWGFRGPLGAWVCIWGSFAMIVSGPFDDWWHNAYGLDVEILSPPHTVLALGIVAIQIGAMLMVLARQNNHRSSTALGVLFGYAGGVLVLMMATLATEQVAFANSHHGTQFYVVSAGLFPLFLVGISRGSGLRWGATGSAACYMGATLLMMWILQAFPAQPLLGPVLRQVDRMVPPPFPLLLVAPALAVDLLLRRLLPEGSSRLRTWAAVPVVGAAFVLVLLAVQWPFADFLLSEGARNAFFGADQWDYNSSPGPWQYEYWDGPIGAAGLGWALLLGAVSTRAGLWWGDWMRRVRR
ncbi:MAG TPA: hypothetical protein VFQ22_02070 [Longimicrobiales bacterium]|nr:hypothetical protein [Longimicrobiales bacterium]